MRHRHLHAFEPASASASARARRRDHPRRLDAGGGVVAVVGAVVGVLLERQPHAHPRRAARVRLARARGDADAPIDVHEPRSTNHSSIEWMNRIESNRIESRATTRRPSRESNERRRRTRRTPPVVRRRARALGVHGRERLTSERTKGPRASRAHTHTHNTVLPDSDITLCHTYRVSESLPYTARAFPRAGGGTFARDDDARGCRPRIRSARSSATARASVPIARLGPPRTTRRRRRRDAIERRNARPPPAR